MPVIPWKTHTGVAIDYGNETFAHRSTNNIFHVVLICPLILSPNWAKMGTEKGQVSVPNNIYVFCHMPYNLWYTIT